MCGGCIGLAARPCCVPSWVRSSVPPSALGSVALIRRRGPPAGGGSLRLPRRALRHDGAGGRRVARLDPAVGTDGVAGTRSAAASPLGSCAARPVWPAHRSPPTRSRAAAGGALTRSRAPRARRARRVADGGLGRASAWAGDARGPRLQRLRWRRSRICSHCILAGRPAVKARLFFILPCRPGHPSRLPSLCVCVCVCACTCLRARMCMRAPHENAQMHACTCVLDSAPSRL